MSQSDNSLKVRLGLYPVKISGIGFPHPPRTSAPSPKGRLTDTEAISSSILNFQFFMCRRKSFVCDDSRNIIYAKHNIICRKATSFYDRKRKRYLRLWRKMVFLPAVGNTTLRVVVPLPPREGRRIPKQFKT